MYNVFLKVKLLSVALFIRLEFSTALSSFNRSCFFQTKHTIVNSEHNIIHVQVYCGCCGWWLSVYESESWI